MVASWGVGFLLSVFSHLDDQTKLDIYAPAIANGEKQDHIF